MDSGFRIVCNKCHNEVYILKDSSNKRLEAYNFSLYPIQSDKVNINCDKCGNEIFINER
jgi:ribosomal protein S27AE